MPTPYEKLATMLGVHAAARNDAAALMANAAAVARGLIEHSAKFQEIQAGLADVAGQALPTAPTTPAGAPKWVHTLTLLVGMAAVAWPGRTTAPAPAPAPAQVAVAPAQVAVAAAAPPAKPAPAPAPAPPLAIAAKDYRDAMAGDAHAIAEAVRSLRITRDADLTAALARRHDALAKSAYDTIRPHLNPDGVIADPADVADAIELLARGFAPEPPK